ncbi:MAG: cysteine--tRNA ligase [Pseudomonadales bacterium]|nr:cysteine--tRNA ligase [Pseudomonadales bacterium]
MQLKIHNTFSGKKELFVPRDPNRITLYACGPTVYNYIHIGNGRPAVVFDVLFRLLKAGFPNVAYARNITDIDDKINAAVPDSNDKNAAIRELSDYYSEAYTKDVSALGTLTPTFVPRATDHIEEIIALIKTLIERGHAYAAEGHVLFDVPSYADYGQLSNRSLQDMLDGARVEVAPYKKDPKDFVLWKPSDDKTPGWDSPWGKGRPGWHIECSAMIHKHLGPSIDIHGGGSDLIFPHHENELAQGRCAFSDEPFANYWMHNGMLTLGNEKMSKSVGNIETIRDLLKDFRGETLRYALLTGKYRSPLSWSRELVAQAKSSLDRLYQSIMQVGDTTGSATSLAYSEVNIKDLPPAVVKALSDDLNTPLALAAMHEIAGDINKSDDPKRKAELKTQLLASGWLLGLLTYTPATWFQGEDKREIDETDIQALIAERNQARSDKNWQKADEVRDHLLAMNIELEDTASGTRWKTI